MPIEPYETIGSVRKHANKILRISEGLLDQTPLAGLETEDLLEMLESAARISNNIRTSVKNPDLAFVKARQKAETVEIVKGKCIRIGYRKQGQLRIQAPPLVKLSNRKSMHIAYEIADALLAFKSAGNLVPSLRSFWIVYKRFAQDLGAESLCDNDNMETKKITNALMDAMGVSDNPRFASFLYTTIESSQNLTEITVFPREQFSEVYVYLGMAEPEVSDYLCP